MAFSFSLTVTASPFKPQVHAFSQRAGHTLEVNSGKLFVLNNLLAASSHCPLNTKSFHSGIKLLSGHPTTD